MQTSCLLAIEVRIRMLEMKKEGGICLSDADEKDSQLPVKMSDDLALLT
jgi:hypothetical protein